MAGELPFVDYQRPKIRTDRPLIAIIGEAPGADEVRLGRPFVGRAGQLLDRVLAQAGIDREACLVANVFRYRPPDNKVGHFFASRRRAAERGEPLAESLGKMGAEYCLERYRPEIDALRDELLRLDPAAIVAVGRTPLWALTGLNGITALRGKVLKGSLHDAPVIATFHPSFVMRQNSIGPETEAAFLADLKLARALAAQPGSRSASSSIEIGAPG